MFRRFNLFLVAMAMVIAPFAMQSGVAMVAGQMDQMEMALDDPCSVDDAGSEDELGARARCCIAICSVMAPLGTASIDPTSHRTSFFFGLPAARPNFRYRPSN